MDQINARAGHQSSPMHGPANDLRYVSGSQTYVAGIDGLRAVAIVSVMLYHLNPSLLPGGFSGVDVFFVISGYAVSTSLSLDARKSLGRFILGFYARRLVRILPALILCLLVTSFATNLFVPASWLSEVNRDTALYAFFGLSNFALMQWNDGYFSPRIEYNPFVHTWSLAIEEQFYLVFPVLFYIWLRPRAKKPALRLVGSNILLVLLVASLAYSVKATATNPEAAYYLLPTRFWELACGAWLFQLQRDGYTKFVNEVAPRCVLLLGALLISLAFLFSDPRAFPFPWALLSVAGSALMIAGVSSPSVSGTFLSRLLDYPLVALVGKLSYSLYLWHWPVYVLFRWTVGLDDPTKMILAVGTTVLLAYISFRLVENPIRRNQYVRSRPKAVIALVGCATVVLSWSVAAKLFDHQRQLSRSVTRDSEVWYPYAWPNSDTRSKICDSERKSFLRHGFHITAFQPNKCIRTPAFGHRLFVFGDSHADAYLTMLSQLTERMGIEVWIYAKGGCSIANMIRPLSSDLNCIEFEGASLADISEHTKRGDVLLLAALRMNRYENSPTPFADSTVNATHARDEAVRNSGLALDEAKTLLNSLDGSGLKIVMDAPMPILRAPPFRCSDWFNARNPVCRPGLSVSRAELLERRKPIMESIAKLQVDRPDILVWDTFATLCPDDPCSGFDKTNKPLFFDVDHLSANGNRVIYPSFEAVLVGVWGHGDRDLQTR